MRKDASSLEIRQRARQLRQNATDAERRLWQVLRGRKANGLKFRRQHPIARFIVDFYCAEHRLVVELDGGVHDGRAEPDNVRTAYLESLGYRVLRFRNEEVTTRMATVLEAIVAACAPQPLPQPLPTRGEGGLLPSPQVERGRG
jgi:very-short-patch-repair endonuclease